MRSDDAGRELEDILDNALLRYGQAEPRPGLEMRVMARLAQERKAPRRILSWWAFAATAAVLAFALAWFVNRARHVPETARVATGAEVKTGQSTSQASKSYAQATALRRGARIASRATPQASAAKRDRFPSPAPLTEQELMLARYVRDFPDRAALTARAQTELYKQEAAEMTQPPKNTDQPE